MLRPRVIPCLLVHRGGLVKTTRFAHPRYVGDPLNAVRIFNEKEVDELVVFDIDATCFEREPDYQLIANLANECRMPLCYGGGVSTVQQFERIVSLGVEKVAISSAAVARPELITDAAARVGSQSIVVVIDVKAAGRFYREEVWTHNGTRNTGLNPVEFARHVEAFGCGEIVLNSIDRDGTMQGYDLDLVRKVLECVSVPITVLGGAGSMSHVRELISVAGTVGAAAGSLFIFKGKYRAVLISYPNRIEKDAIVGIGAI